MDLSNRLNGRERITDAGNVDDWRAAYGDTEFVRYNNAWASFLAMQSDTNKREDGYDRHALGQKTYEELLATDIARDERNKDNWDHVTGPMLAIGHAGKGMYDFGALWVRGVANWFTGDDPDAAMQFTMAVFDMPDNLSNGFARALQDFSSGDSKRMWYGAANLFMYLSPYAAGKAGEAGMMVRGAPISVLGRTVAAVESIDAPAAATVAKSALPSIDDLSRAASTLNRNQLTDAGRALQKHSDRPGSVFSATNSKAVTLNSEGQMIVDSILSNPGTKIVSRTVNENKTQISVIEAVAPDGRAIRFSGDGKRLIGFRESSLK